MKVLIVALLLGVAAVAARTPADEKVMWEDFKNTYGRGYSFERDVHHFNCFRRNLAVIDEMNSNAHDLATYGVNQFSDLCAEDFKVYHNLKLDNNTMNAQPAEIPPRAGSSVDWVKKGAVTPIKNQGMCGSCWSFGCTGNVEGQWHLAGHTLIGFSEEELVQCDHIAAMGCHGAQNLYQSYEWIIRNGGIDTERDYPYTSGTGVVGQCNTQKTQKKIGKIASYVNLPSNEDSMARYMFQHGPLQIGVDALSWQSYSGGIMSNCYGRQLDHSVLAVGYNDNHSPPYWIVKNSWGTSWGENGYIRLAKGSDQCGLKTMPSSSKVN
eukprot:NODE_853_length_1153_cov_212.752437_g811_i0.p1 GENE.NODE_853_length_1153_cov_212.752437_g811_i0~~NODE_853_length_1153_cov_212.752437_g811_i0.p1  ORF type:complete len:323 (+),score=79.77 NODE_853_length_1153_cov_212.752437_g811_i0:69-1037(+)